MNSMILLLLGRSVSKPAVPLGRELFSSGSELGLCQEQPKGELLQSCTPGPTAGERLSVRCSGQERETEQRARGTDGVRSLL